LGCTAGTVKNWVRQVEDGRCCCLGGGKLKKKKITTSIVTTDGLLVQLLIEKFLIFVYVQPILDFEGSLKQLFC